MTTRNPRIRNSTAVRLVQASQRLRVFFAGLVAAAVVALPFGLDASRRVALGALWVGFVVAILVVARLALPDRPVVARCAIAACTLLATGTAVLVAPELGALYAVVALASVITAVLIGSRREALALAAAWAAAGALVNGLVDAAARHAWPYVAMWAVALVVAALGVDALTAERRRVTENLMRLHAAMRSMPADPDLSGTLESVVESVGAAIGAVATGILLRRDDRLLLAAPRLAAAPWTQGEVGAWTHGDAGTEGASPVSLALATGASVVVRDVAADARFPAWAERWARTMREQWRIRSLVVVPLGLADDLIGLLVANFSWVGAIDGEELAILEAYAEQAALLVARAQAYEQQREAAEQLAEADRLKSEFLAMVSHELRTPLTAAKGFVDTVLLHWDRLDEGRRRELLSRASDNADDLTRLIGQLLDFSRVDADRVDIRPGRVLLREVVDDIVARLAPAFADHELVVEIDPDLAVTADVDAVGHVLANLLSNAVKFSPSGSEVTIGARVAGLDAVVSVSDRGIGIPADDVSRVFERFYQSEQPGSVPRGTGIGLAIARRFVELHGGRIWVESVPGEGSTFVFTLPRPPTDVRLDLSATPRGDSR